MRARTISIREKDLYAIVAFFHQEEATLRNSYGRPGQLEKTWRAEYRAAHPESYQIFKAAEKAIARGLSAGAR